MSHQYLIPRGGDREPLRLDLSLIRNAEARVVEIQAVTPQKAPELLATFNGAYIEASRLLMQMEQEHVLAQRRLEQVKSEVLLDRLPGILKEKGLATARSPLGSEDIRQAIMMTQADYLDALETADRFEAFVRLMKGKLKGIEMAYTAVKKILGENAFNFNSPAPTGGGAGDANAGQTVPSSGFGTPRY